MKQRSIEEIKEDLQEAQNCYHEFKEKGEKALSKYDKMFGYGVETNLNLLASHIHYYEEELKEATRFGEQLSMF